MLSTSKYGLEWMSVSHDRVDAIAIMIADSEALDVGISMSYV